MNDGPPVHQLRRGDRLRSLETDESWVWDGQQWNPVEGDQTMTASKSVMSYEQCNNIYQDMLAAHFRLAPTMPSDELAKQYQRLVGMLSAIRVIRGDQLEGGLLLDIVEADIRGYERGLDPALNVQWI